MKRTFSRFACAGLLVAGCVTATFSPRAALAAACHADVFAMPVMLDDSQIGSLEVTSCGDNRRVNKADYLFMLYHEMNDAAFDKLGEDEPGDKETWPVGQALGDVQLLYDDSKVALVLEIPLAQRKPSQMNMRQGFEDMEKGDYITPEDFSAFLNLYGAQGYSSGVGMAQGRMAARLDTDMAFNWKGTVLEGTVNYVENAGHPFMADNVRLIRDDTDDMVRYQMGELSYPITGFQGYRQILGVGLARNFGLQPYRVTSPAGRTNFTLGSLSTVDVYVNNQRVRSMQLARGTYELNDFPVVNGVNNVRLMITDAYGRTEELFFPVVNDADLLDGGLWEFSFNAGIPVEKVARAKLYDAENPMLTGFARYGLSDRLTVGANIQADEKLQMGGVEHTLGGRLGTLKAEFAASHMEDKVGKAVRLEYRNLLTQDATQLGKGEDLWSVVAEHLDTGFRMDSTGVDNLYGYSLQAAYSRNLTDKITGSFGVGYKMGRDGMKDDRDVFTGFYWRAAQGVAVNINAMYSTENQYDMLLGVSWFPHEKRYQVNTSYDVQDNSLRLDGMQASEGFNQGLEMRAGIVTGDARDTATGSAIYNGGRGFVRVTHDVVSTLDQEGVEGGLGTQTQLQVGTALVYAGGQAAVAKPINNSFLILSPKESLKGAGLSVNPMETADHKTVYEAKSSFLGPAVLTDMMPYTYHKVQVGTLKERDEETLMGQSVFTVKPQYKSGMRLKVGSDALAYASGAVVDEDGLPVLLASGEIKPVAGEANEEKSVQMIFTNRQGGFTTEALKPGRYVLKLAGYPHKQAVLEIPAKLKGQVKVGNIMLAEAE